MFIGLAVSFLVLVFILCLFIKVTKAMLYIFIGLGILIVLPLLLTFIMGAGIASLIFFPMIRVVFEIFVVCLIIGLITWIYRLIIH